MLRATPSATGLTLPDMAAGRPADPARAMPVAPAITTHRR